MQTFHDIAQQCNRPDGDLFFGATVCHEPRRHILNFMDNPDLQGKTNLVEYTRYVSHALPMLALMFEKRTLILLQCRQYREINGVPTLANQTIECAAECTSVVLALHTIPPIQHLKLYMLPLLKDMFTLSENYMLISNVAIQKWWGHTLRDSIH